MSSGRGEELPVPISTYTGEPCTGHPRDMRCIECATDEELITSIRPYLRDIPEQKASEPNQS